MAANRPGRLRVSTDAGVAEVRLNRPEKRNALDLALLAELREAMVALGARDDVRALVLSGAGPVFCAGADLGAFAEVSSSPERLESWLADGRSAFAEVASFPAPVVVAVTGGAFGGGLELALHADLRVAAPDAVLALPEVSAGWLPGWGALDLLPRQVGAGRATYLTLTGTRLDAADALAWGLVHEVTDDPRARALELAAAFARLPGDVVRSALCAMRGTPA